MAKRSLTAAAVERLKPPAKGQAEHFDRGYPGLALRLSYGGGRSWVFFYRLHGKQRRLTLGTHPAMGLAEAREAWRTARKQVERGEDPAGEKAEAKRREPDTVRSVGEAFIAKWARPRNRTADEIARMFQMHLYPALGHRRIETVTRRDILDLLDGIEAKASGARANRVLANVRRLFAWAVERGIIGASPAGSVRAPGQEMARDRVLSDDELRAFLRACERLGEPFGPLFHLLLLTGQRREEVAGMRWDELDGTDWHLPAERTKNKRANTVPLAAQAAALIEARHRVVGSPYVFPARVTRGDEPRHVSGFGRAKERLDGFMLEEMRKADPDAVLAPFVIHDLRRTAASGMARLGIAPHVVEAVLNHRSGIVSGVARVYNRFSYDAEKRAALEAWANWLDALDRPAENVVRLAEAAG